LASRKFGQKAAASGSGVFQYGGKKNLLDDSDLDIVANDNDNNDDTMSTGDVFVMGGQSDYDDQSEMSIRKYEDDSSDGGSNLNVMRIGGSNNDGGSDWDASS
jgi:hypothetical protein